jgi:hypothetical protein
LPERLGTDEAAQIDASLRRLDKTGAAAADEIRRGVTSRL